MSILIGDEDFRPQPTRLVRQGKFCYSLPCHEPMAQGLIEHAE
ncbi:MAG: hypothetical protein WCI11_01520 [Candidatus Methylumidiphilus sp.]